MKIQTINSIETSSICDLSCQYCPARFQGEHRPTGFMTMEIFKESIKWARYFAQQGTQREVNLFGVGEPTLNGQIVDMVAHARENLPPRIKVHLNTNGNTMTERLARELKNAGVTSIDITGHRAKSAAKTLRIFKKYGIPGQMSFDAILSPNNWAGQVDWFEPDYGKPYPCPWVFRGQVMIMSNGDVTRCCIDALGKGIMGRVFDKLDEIEVTPFSLCQTCHHTL